MRLVNYTKSIVSSIEDHKKVGRIPAALHARTKEFLRQLDCLNATKRDGKRYGGDLISEIEVAGIFSKFISPNSVTVTGSIDDHDYLIRDCENIPPDQQWDAEQFHAYATFVNGILKRDDYVSITEARVDVVLTGDNKYNFSNGDVCPAKVQKGVIPFPISTCVLKSDYYLEQTRKVILRVIEHMAD